MNKRIGSMLVGAVLLASSPLAAQKVQKGHLIANNAAFNKAMLKLRIDAQSKGNAAREKLFAERAAELGLGAPSGPLEVLPPTPGTLSSTRQYKKGWLVLAPAAKKPIYVTGIMLATWRSLGAEGSDIGFPLAEEQRCRNVAGARYQPFMGGMLYLGPQQTKPLRGPLGNECPTGNGLRLVQAAAPLLEKDRIARLKRADCAPTQGSLLRKYLSYQRDFDLAFPDIAKKSAMKTVEQTAALTYLAVAMKRKERLTNAENSCIGGLLREARRRDIDLILTEKVCGAPLRKSECRLAQAQAVCVRNKRALTFAVSRLGEVVDRLGGIADAAKDPWVFGHDAWVKARMSGKINGGSIGMSLDDANGACLRDVAIARSIRRVRARLEALGRMAKRVGDEVIGFADLHTHQFGNLGMGGLKTMGKPFAGDPGATPDQQLAAALPWCAYNYPGPTSWVIAHGLGGSNDLPGEKYHYNGGYPEFNGWPNWRSSDHQRMYHEWVRRAFEGGLRLMVMLAVNNEMQCRASNNDRPNHPCDDMTTVYEQLQAAKDLQAYIDAQSGGAGRGWYRVVYTPAEARRVIAENKMAVVLGVEVDTVFGCFRAGSATGQGALGVRADSTRVPRATCSEAEVQERLEQLYAAGARQITPIHFSDNLFGSPAIYHEAFNLSNWWLTGWHYELEQCTDPSIEFAFGHLGAFEAAALWAVKGYSLDTSRLPSKACHKNGLTDMGKKFMRMLMNKGMLIDVDHMSEKSFWDTAREADAFGGYPLISSHTGFRELGFPKEHAKTVGEEWIGLVRSETMKSPEQLRKIAQLGGMVAPIMLADAVNTAAPLNAPGGLDGIANDCDGSSKSWAQAYLYAQRFFPGRGVGLATDTPGLKSPGPRFGRDACPGRIRDRGGNEQRAAQRKPISYTTLLKDCRGYRLYSDAGTEWGSSLVDPEGLALEGICLGLSHVNSNPDRECNEQKPNCGGALGCQRVRNICKGVAGARLWRSCDADPDRPLVDIYAGPAVRRGACKGIKPNVSCEAIGDGTERDACREVARMKTGFVAPAGPTFVRNTAGQRDFDFNIDGMAHYGMLKEFVQDLRNIGMSEAQLRPLFRSTEEYLKIWERVSRGRAATVNATTLRTPIAPAVMLPRPTTLPPLGRLPGIDLPGGDLRHAIRVVGGATACERQCRANPRCKAWSYVSPTTSGGAGDCWIKGVSNQPRVPNPRITSGVVR